MEVTKVHEYHSVNTGEDFNEIWLTTPELGIEICYRDNLKENRGYTPYCYTIKGMDLDPVYIYEGSDIDDIAKEVLGGVWNQSTQTKAT